MGALARGVNTAKARSAYEEAFKLQPDDFWTCVELARLRELSGNTDSAREAAEAAAGLARGERNLAIAKSELADVRLKLGDLNGAWYGYREAAIALRRLAEKNPGSAEARRDVSVSMNKLGDVLVKAGDLEGAKGRFEESLKVKRKSGGEEPRER